MDTQTLHILVADNEEIVRKLFARYLSDMGHAFDEAVNGADCLKKMAVRKYDLVFLDLVMPGMDGEAALESIQRRFPGTSVVVMSSQDDDRVISNILANGARAYLAKPFTQEHVAGVIRALEDDRKGVLAAE